MNLVDALVAICHENVENISTWGRWTINEKNLPDDIALSSGNWFEKNLELREKLHQKWKHANTEEKTHLLKWYIQVWGRVKWISDESFEFYATASPETLMSMGMNGVASWSKALCVYDPYQYANFDAKISSSLNTIQILYNVEDLRIFPIFPTRSKNIQNQNKKIKYIAEKRNYQFLNSLEFYQFYLDTLKSAKLKMKQFYPVKLIFLELTLFNYFEFSAKKI